MSRPTFSEACARYVHRFTMEHVPAWSRQPLPNGAHYAPQYRTDAEWYAATKFPGEPSHPEYPRRVRYCYSAGQTWPLGMTLAKPYAMQRRS